jgi:MFS family permease
MNDKAKKYLAIFALGISGASIYLLPYIKYIFYDQQIAAMGITNKQSGLLLSMYAIGNMILYIPGGILADKLSPKKCLMYSLITTTALSVLYGVTLSYGLALVIWLLLSLTTVLVFWAALIKAVRIIGSEEEQGRMFGLYYSINGVSGAIFSAIALWASNHGSDPRGVIFNVVMVYSASTALAALMVALFVKENKTKKLENLKKKDEDKFDVKDVVGLIKNPFVWIISLIVFCGYSLYSSTSYFTPYLTSVVGVSPTESGIFSIIRNYLFLLLAPVSGYLADKVFKSTSKWIMIGFSILVVLFIGVMVIPAGTSDTIVSIYTLLPGAFGLAVYGIVFSVIGEAKIPAKVTGTVIGIASVIGYSPDLFMSTMFGDWLDKYGNSGYNYIFIYLVVTSIVGLFAAYLVRRRASNKIEHRGEESIS